MGIVGNIECVTISQKVGGNEPNASTPVIRPIITPFQHSFPNYDKLFDSFLIDPSLKMDTLGMMIPAYIYGSEC